MATALIITRKLPGGIPERLTVHAERALIGSGAHCEVQLPVEHAAVEHLMVEVRQAALFAEARTLTPAPHVNGAPFTQGRLLPDSVVRIGPVELSFALSEVAVPGATRARAEGRSYVRLGLLVALAAALAVNAVPSATSATSAMEMPASVPDLWGAAGECPQASKELAGMLAFELVTDADGKRERAPFHPEDGVAAVTLYRRATACFRRAGQAREADDTARSGDALARSLADEFRVNRLRLERALASQEWATARKVIRLLTFFLQGRSDEYVSWLSNVDRRIAVKFAAETAQGSPE